MIGSDDARLTAYAVDEVDAETAAAIEAAIRDSAAHGAAVEETREAAALVAAVFAAEAVLELDAAQRGTIAEAASRADRPRWRSLAVGGGLAAAATVVLAVLVAREQGPPPLPPRVPAAATASPATTAPGPGPQEPIPAVDLSPASPQPSRSRRTVERRAAAPSAAAVEIPPETPPVAVPSDQPASPDTVTVRGTLQDTSGAVLPGATVTARVLPGGEVRTASTGRRGDFELKGLPVGPLEVRAELPGFSPVVGTLSPGTGADVAWNQTMQVAGVMESIEVTGEAPVIATSTTLGGVRSQKGPRSDRRQVSPEPSVGPATEAYGYRADNAFVETRRDPRSTFSLDVDTASYANVRRFLDRGQRPPADAVRIEELVNYFPYDYAAPTGGERFAADLEVGPAPWNPEHRLLRIGLQDGRARPRAATGRATSSSSSTCPAR